MCFARVALDCYPLFACLSRSRSRSRGSMSLGRSGPDRADTPRRPRTGPPAASPKLAAPSRLDEHTGKRKGACERASP